MASLLYAESDKNKSRKWGNKKGKSKGPIKLKTHNVERSILEGVFARGDRRLAASVEHAYRAGARFDGWDECFKSQLWNEAFAATSTDPDFYAHRERGQHEVFPWTHLHGGPEQDYLARQYDDAFTQIGMAGPEPAGLITSRGLIVRGSTPDCFVFWALSQNCFRHTKAVEKRREFSSDCTLTLPSPCEGEGF
jgi:hypothetical protein